MGVCLLKNQLMNVGVVGLGKMGKPMVQHLSQKGYHVTTYDIREEAMREVAGANVEGSYSLAELASRSQVVFVIVGFDNEVKMACQGEDGLFKGLQSGSVLVVCSTVEPETMTWLKEQAPEGIHLLDAPICRGEIAAIKGDLLALVGGDEETFKICQPLLQTFCSDIEYLGPLGSGQVGKALNNFLLWSCISANYEVFKLAEQYGLDQETLRTALLKSSGENWALHTWNRPRKMPWAEKDMMILLKMADQKTVPMPMAGFIKENIKQVKKEKNLSAPKSTIGTN
jgi:3-hydroxyisobutyrate dehydrogenase-like beta-hydroxyacid dehydrogenase